MPRNAPDAIGGLPIKGDRDWYSMNDVGPQIGPEEFVAKIKEILDTGEVSRLTWRQDTPYFNDGDACVFGIGEVYAYPTPELDRAYTAEASEDEWGFYDEIWMGMEALRTSSYGGPETRVSATTLDLLRNFPWRASHHVCLEYFGDPAEVVATKDGFTVETYDHD